MRSLVFALLLGVCALVLVCPGTRAQGLQPSVTVTSGGSPVVQADQTINTSGTVTINSGTSVTFQAGNTISLQNGFQASAGSNFHAFVAAPDFVVNVTPTSSSTILAGGGVTYSVTVSSIFNFTGTVYFSPAGVTGLPQGATASFSASSLSPQANNTSGAITLTITTAAGITGNYAFTVLGTSLSYPSHQGTSSLSIQDFYLTLSPTTFTVYSLGTATYQISVTGLNGFSNSISLYFAWNTTYSTCTVQSGFPSQILPGAAPVTFTLYENACGLQGTYEFDITASWNGYSRLLKGYLAILPGTGSSNGGPTVTCSASPNPATIGQTVTFAANPLGGAAPYTAYSWSGQVSGTTQSVFFAPPGVGSFESSVTVTDSNGKTGSNSCSVTVQQGGNALTILTSSTLPYGTAGTAYSQTLAATGGTGSYTWSALSTLPAGLTLSSSGVLSGTPTTAGNYTFYIKVADTGGHSVSSEFALTIASGGAQSSIQISLAYPQLSGTYPGGTHQFTFHFTDPLGPTDIAGGQIAFNADTTSPELPVCQLDWYTNGNIDINGVVYGSFGSGTLSSMYCNVYTSESSLTPTAQGYDVSVVLSFPQPLPNTILPAWTRGFPKNSGTGDFTPVGAHVVAHELPGDEDPEDPPDDPFPSVPVPPPSGLGPCVGFPSFDSQLSRYSDGTLAAELTAYTNPDGNPGWVNTASNGHLISSLGDIASNTGTATSMDDNIAVLPFNSGSGNSGGIYHVRGAFTFSHQPRSYCYVVLNYAFPAYIDAAGDAEIPGYDQEFNIPGGQVDPTPVIYSIDLNPPLVAGNSATATITGVNFGTATGTLSFSSSDVGYTLAPSPQCPSGWCSSQIQATLSASANAQGTYTVRVVSAGAAGGNGFQSSPGQSSTSSPGTLNVESYSVSLSPCSGYADPLNSNQLDLSTGDNNRCLTTTVSPSFITFTPAFPFGLANNANNSTSNCAPNLGFSNASGQGPVNTVVTAAAAGCGGIFNVNAVAGPAGKGSNFVQTVVPPQIMIQTLVGEAGGQTSPGDSSMPSVLLVARNRFGDSGFPGGVTGTWQAVLVPNQFYGASNTTSTGVEPELDVAASVFSGASTVDILNCEALWSPTNTQFAVLQTWLNSQANAISDSTWASSSVGAPILWAGQPKQAVIKTSIANNVVSGKTSAPAFVLFRPAPSPTDPAVITIP